jgi:hypothetical protein
VRQLVRNSLAENSEPQLSEASSWYGLRTTSAGHFLRLFETEIFETYDGNRRALFVTFDGAPEPEVIQPSAKVIQHDGERGTEKRISQLESQIDQLRSIIFQGGSEADADSKKGAPESGFEPESEPRQGTSQAMLAPARSARSL